MPDPFLSDEEVARLSPIATIDLPFLARVLTSDGEEAPVPVQAFCGLAGWEEAMVLATAAADGVPARTDLQGFAVNRDGTVTLFDDLDRAVKMSGEAFAGLMCRLLTALIDAATALSDPVIETGDWPDLVGARDRLCNHG
jgi:hypothetical protein